MLQRFVVDISVVMSWCFRDEMSEYADTVLDSLTNAQAVVPGIWPLEVTNVLSMAQKKKRLGRAGSARFLELLRSLPVVVEQELPARVFAEIFALAEDTGLSTYDAFYLDLAMREGLPLASLDESLRKAAKACRVPIYSP
jgi:predicted nucleic acid-binding protein